METSETKPLTLHEIMENRPIRPRHLRNLIIRLYTILILVFLMFIGINHFMHETVPQGMFKTLDGSFIPLDDFGT